MEINFLTYAEITALTLSLKVAITASLIGLPIAIVTGYLMARRDFPFKNLLDSLLHLPLVVPPVITGYILLLIFAPNSWLGQTLNDLGLSIAFHWHGAALASIIMAFPLMVRSIRQAFEAIPPVYQHAAKSLGLPRSKIFFSISLPLALPGIISGFVLGFARAIGEFGATITFVSNIPAITQTLPLAIYSASQSPTGDAVALRLIFICLIPAIGSLLISNYFASRHKKKLSGPNTNSGAKT